MLEVLRKGKINLYYEGFYQGLYTYYLEKDSKLIPIDLGSGMFDFKKRFQKKMRKYFAGYPIILAKVEHLKEKEEHLILLVDTYNKHY